MSDDSSSCENNRQSLNARLHEWFEKITQRQEEEELSVLLEEREEGDDPLTEEERDLIRAAIQFRDIEADDVAIPRNDIVYLRSKMSFEDILQAFIQTGHSRLLVCAQDLDDVIGFVTLKDIVKFINAPDNFKLNCVLRPCPFVPMTMSVNRVLQLMKSRKVQMAVVLDEYGGTSGLVSMKDILEELVGDIGDEDDSPDDVCNARALPGGKFEVDPRMAIADFESLAQTDIAALLPSDSDVEDEFETVGGLVLHLASRVPEISERFELEDGSLLEVIDADGRRIKNLKFVPYVARKDKAK